ncbi:MAG: IS1634 family transposase, partial [Acidimicrobiia bacterium]|nr:IS1634 family transposase [Acidimicrobiia bacterium]
AYRNEEGKTRHRTLLRLGEASTLRDSGELDRIIAGLKRHTAAGGDEAADSVPIDGLEAESAPGLGAVEAVAAWWDRVGLGEHFGDGDHAQAIFAMVANRLVSPASKRRVPEWAVEDVAMPAWFDHPQLHTYYRAVDTVADEKEATEEHLYGRLTDLTNLDLSLVCYDLTSTFFEGSTQPSDRFPSKAFGYSRDHRSDRPQVVIGLLCTTDGIPIAHHVFAGNTADVTTLPGVLADLRERFSVGSICVVADRGLVSENNLDALDAGGFDHVLATRLHRDAACVEALEASTAPDVTWTPVPQANSAAADVTLADGRRCVVVASFERHTRDTSRTTELVARTEAKLLALEDRVRQGRLKDPAKIGRAAQRILGDSGISRLFDLEIEEGRFLYHYNDAAFDYEERLLAGRYVLTTSLTTQATAAQVVLAYRQLTHVEDRFRALKDFLHLRPVYHWTENRVRGHIGICVLAAVIEALIGRDLTQAAVADPDLPDQALTAARALRELDRIRRVTLTTDNHTIGLVTHPTALQGAVLTAVDVDTRNWNKAHIT